MNHSAQKSLVKPQGFFHITPKHPHRLSKSSSEALSLEGACDHTHPPEKSSNIILDKFY